MAKKSMIAKDLKRKKMIEKYAAKRAELKAAGDQEGFKSFHVTQVLHDLRTATILMVDHAVICDDLA